MKNTGKRIYRTLALAIAAIAVAAFAYAQDQAAESSITEINLAESSEHGQYLVDQDGMALYLFRPDAQGPSTCYDDCATNWPPVTVAAVEAMPSLGEGLDAGLLGTVERDDGALQLTYNGWPLYYYLGDMEAGVTTGQGLGDNWYIVDTAGNAIGADMTTTPEGGAGQDDGGQDDGGQDDGGQDDGGQDDGGQDDGGQDDGGQDDGGDDDNN